MAKALHSKNLVENYTHSKDWRTKENSNSPKSFGGLVKYISGEVSKNYYLNHVYGRKIRKAYLNGDIHIHDIRDLTVYCCGYSLETILMKGVVGVSNIPVSSPAKHFSSILAQVINLTTIFQNEQAGAVAFNSVDTLLAPFIAEDGLTYKEVRQTMQNFIYAMNSNSRCGCVPSTTELLTPSGFKKYNELSIGDLVYTWNDGKLNVQPIDKMNVFEVNEDLYSFKGRDYSQTVTANHRVLRKKFNVDKYEVKYADDLSRINTELSFPVAMLSNDIGGIDMSDEMIELLAFIITDGGFDKNRIRIYKSQNRWGNERLVEILEKLNIGYYLSTYDSTVSCDEQHREYAMNKYGLKTEDTEKIRDILNYKKEIPEILLGMNKRQAELFINTWVRLDGISSTNTLQCDNNNTADMIQHIAFLAGYGSKKYIREKSETNRTMYVQLYLNKNKGNNRVEKIPYKGIVWCPTTKDGIVVFREEGRIFVSGNSEPAFSNISLDVTIPQDMMEKHTIIGGKITEHTYSEYQREMNMFNRAFCELMIQGDSNGKPFAYPLPNYNIGKRFDWDNPHTDAIFEMAGKYGYPYFSNYLNSEMEEGDLRSMCCRLRLDLGELKRRNGGLFGSGDSTGSIGVCTINLPRIAYRSKHRNFFQKLIDKRIDEEYFYDELDELLSLSKDSLEIKRKFLQEKVLDGGLIPAFSEYVGTLNNHFSTIGDIGKNEMCMNFLGEDILSVNGHEFALKVGEHIRLKLQEFQKETGVLYNYEQSPAESTCYRLAKKDREKYPEIYTQGSKEVPYYTNSCHIPVRSVESISQICESQNDLQPQYTGGNVTHFYLNGAITGRQAKHIIKTVFTNYKLPYVTLSPIIRTCKSHGYIVEEVDYCPKCGEKLDKQQRITGYIRPVENFNAGKTQEFMERSQLETKTKRSKLC